MRNNPNYYEILGVEKGASPEQLKEARKKKVLETHPDKNPGKNTGAEFRLVLKAYQVLSNPQEKAIYNSEFDHRNTFTRPTAAGAKSTPNLFANFTVEPDFYAEYDFLYKFVFIGSASNNMKARIINLMTPQHQSTIGVDFAIKTLVIPDIGKVKIQLWDTAGQERFGSTTKVCLRNAAAVIVVIDVDDPTTWESTKTQLSSHQDTSASLNLIIIRRANPVDFESIQQSMGFAFSQHIEIDLERPDTDALNAFLTTLVREADQKESGLPSEALLEGSAPNEEHHIMTEEDSRKCLVM